MVNSQRIMDEKTLHTLEYNKVLECLTGYCSFSASRELARAQKPTAYLDEARQKLAETREARQLIEAIPTVSIGGARDLREVLRAAARMVVLEPYQLLDVKYTLVAARNLRRTFEREGLDYPYLVALSLGLPEGLGLVDAITNALSERGEILDSASEALGKIRRELKIEHDRLMTQLQRMISNSNITQYLQEALIMQRDGRYVLPVRADFKGRVKGIIHDQSASGATVFMEPLSIVEKNNAYRELQLAERDEERRILSELTALVAEHSDTLEAMLVALAEIDLAFARAKYANALEAVEPKLHFMTGDEGRGTGKSHRQKDNLQPLTFNPQPVIRLYQARHPLLNPEAVVPIDVELAPQTRALVVTGPNTGGKTVTLKTIGLLALMAQSGLHIPAGSGSEFSIFETIYADIGDEQSIEQSLSTFSGHITNIIHILERADTRSLVILDELGAGTDPQEGAALARSLLTHLVEREITTLVTTHHPELKAFAHATPGVVNASVEFDLETLRPTYHLTIGLPGRSNALAIAERLGMPAAIISAARQEIDPAELRADDLLDEIYRQRDASREARMRAEAARHQSEKLRAELAARLEEIEDERREVLEDARQEAHAELKDVRSQLKDLRAELRRARQPLAILEQVEAQIEAIAAEVEVPVERHAPDIVQVHGPVRLGSRVQVRTLGQAGIVCAIGEDKIEVQIGNLRVRARLGDLALQDSAVTEDAGQKTEKKQPLPSSSHRSVVIGATGTSPGIELDLRGQRSDEALDKLDGYLDRAYLARLPWVRIIHGKGTGKLREVVREALQQHPQVQSFESGKDGEGGDGVTVATLRS